MDVNKENNITEETEISIEETVKAEETSDKELEEVTAEEDSTSTVSVSLEDIDEELMRYGIETDEEYESEYDEYSDAPKKKGVLQKPVLIAALAFLLTAVVVFGSYFIYNIFSPKGVEGTWLQAEDNTGRLYLEFDDGTVTLNVGGYQRYGYYTIEQVQGYDVLNTEFYEIAVVGTKAVVTYSDDNKSMTLNFIYGGVDLNTVDLSSTDMSTISIGSLEFKRGKAPDIEIDPETITHASADELGITSVNTDESIIGSWRLGIEGMENKYKIYNFNEDGTGNYEIDYVYYEAYGCGLGEICQFKYTVYEDNILITYTYFDGTTTDQSIEYYTDNGNLVLDGVGYEKVN